MKAKPITRREKVRRLKKLGADSTVLDAIDRTAFDQQELDDLAMDDVMPIYVCADGLVLPVDIEDTEYVGVGNPRVEIEGDYVAEGVEARGVRLDFGPLMDKLMKEYEQADFDSDNIGGDLLAELRAQALEDDTITRTGIHTIADDPVLLKYPFEALPLRALLAQTLFEDNPKLALELAEAASSQGDAAATYFLSSAYCYGFGVEVDEDKSRDLRDEAASAGYPPAMFEKTGLFVIEASPFLDSEALEWLQKAAEHGVPAAQALLGRMCLEGLVPEASPSSGVEWLRKAAEGRSVAARLFLASSALDKSGMPLVPWDEGLKWARSLAEDGSPSFEAIMSVLELADPDRQSADPQGALNWLEKIADQGDANAKHLLAHTYLAGDAASQAQGEKLLLEAAKMGDAASQYHLGVQLYDKGGVTNTREGKKWVTKAAKQGHPDARAELIHMSVDEGDFDAASDSMQDVVQDAVNGSADAVDVLNSLGISEEYVQRLSRSVPKDPLGAYNVRMSDGSDRSSAQHEDLRARAIAGDPIAQDELGTHFVRTGQRRDEEIGVGLLGDAAEQGNVSAMVHLASCLLHGIGCKKDPAEAVKWIRKATEEGDAEAKALLGICLLEGVGTRKNRKRGMGMLLDEVNAGNLSAITRLADWYATHSDDDPDYVRRAAALYEKGAEMGQKYSLFRVASYYELLSKEPDADVKAAHWYKKAVELGDPFAALYLARLYFDPDSPLLDRAQGIKYMRMAADKGVLDAQLALGCLYDEDGNLEEAARMYHRAAEKGSPFAATRLAEMYADGKGVPQNNREAFKWAQKAADTDDPEGISLLGTFYLRGIGVPQDVDKAMALCQEAADMGSMSAKLKLLFASESKEEFQDQLREILSTMSEDERQSFIESMDAYFDEYLNAGHDYDDYDHFDPVKSLSGQHLTEGDWPPGRLQGAEGPTSGPARRPDVRPAPKDENIVDLSARRFELLRKQAESGDPKAQDELGSCYLAGKDCDQDPVEAVSWFEKAARQGNALGELHLAQCLLEGNGTPRNEAVALDWLQKSADQDLGAAMGILGTRMLDAADAGRKDQVEALKLLRKAATQGDPDAEYRLGLCYRDGIGVRKSLKDARRMLQRAKKHGNPQAAADLKNLPAK